MKDTTLFSLMLGLPEDWDVAEVVPNLAERTLTLRLKSARTGCLMCPQCGRPLAVQGHDETRLRCPWDVMRFKTTLVFETLRVFCREHGTVDSLRPPDLAPVERSS